ncbi:hypothetical protein LR003_03410 [candidate division NPL-UPA2 bacterium]|nr:hypothetical protein [candidate division NPL-UPA2 bacterium]
MATKKKRSRLIEALCRDGTITETELEKARSGIRTNCDIYSLISRGYLSDIVALKRIIEIEPVPHVILQAYKVNADILRLIPEEYCLLSCILPLEKIGGNLTVAMVDPLDIEIIEEMAEMTGFAIRPVLCSRRDFIDVAKTIWLEAGLSTKEGKK